MFRHYLGLIVLGIVSIGIPSVFVYRPIVAFPWLLSLTLFAMEIIILINYSEDKRSHRVILSFKDALTYMKVNPKRYNTEKVLCIYYMKSEKYCRFDDPHTIIYFTSILSNILYIIHKIKTKYFTNKTNNENKKKDMTRYLDAVQCDIEKLRKYNSERNEIDNGVESL